MAEHLASQGGPLACELIVDRLLDISTELEQQPQTSFNNRLNGRLRGLWRQFNKRLKGRLPDSKYRPEFQRHRYPGLSLAELQVKLEHLGQSLGDSFIPEAEPIGEFVFRIHP
jgi:hypothetical protein